MNKRPATGTPSISITIPACNEQGNVSELYRQVCEAMESVDYPWEILFVDDGSLDMTWAEIESLNGRDPRVKGIRLSRNFGHQYALMAGMRACKGDAVITADADLQHPPSLIPKLIEEWEQGNKIVQTVRIESKNIGPFKRFASRQFYRLFGVLSGVDLAPGMSDFRLLDRQVIDDIASFGEQGLFLRGIVQWVGYPRVTVEYHPAERHAGITKYSLSKMVKLAWIGVSSFSNVPLRIGVFAGIFASIVAFAGVGYAIYGKLVSGSAVAGWASSVAIISFLFAILFVYLGILGEYIGRIVTEVRNRPRYLISEQLGISPDLPRSDVIVRPTRSL